LLNYLGRRKIAALLMASDPTAILELVDALEYLRIENAVYESSIKSIQQLLSDVLPPDTYEIVQQVVRTQIADRTVRDKVRETFAPLRSQLEHEMNQEQVIAELLKVVPPKKGPLN
jgi:hypothetical protein